MQNRFIKSRLIVMAQLSAIKPDLSVLNECILL